MTPFEILLVIIGLILFGGSFFVSEKITATKEQLKVAIDENEVKKLIQLQIKDMDEELTQIIVENIENSTNGVKRSMEKLSNEKIMAIDEYSTTVMESIHKNHNEVLFFYGMLNDKKKEIKETADLIANANKGINKKIAEAYEIIEKMDSQILSRRQYDNQQNVSIDKTDTFEELTNNKEFDTLQFSKSKGEEKVKKTIEKTNKSIEKNKEKLLEDTPLTDNNSIEDYESCEEELLELINDNKDLEVDTKDASNFNDIILEMSEKGQSAFQIAKKLGLGVGEVQLIIDLFKGGKR